MKRTCKSCENKLDLEFFHKEKIGEKIYYRHVCKGCRAKYRRADREKNIEKYKQKEKTSYYRKKRDKKINFKRDNFKKRAQRRLQHAVKYGYIDKKPCIICGNKKSEAHHEDYSKPLDVIWLCTLHHRRYHHGIIDLSPPKKSLKYT